jgi:hypothetical protein
MLRRSAATVYRSKPNSNTANESTSPIFQFPTAACQPKMQASTLRMLMAPAVPGPAGPGLLTKRRPFLSKALRTGRRL